MLQSLIKNKWIKTLVLIFLINVCKAQHRLDSLLAYEGDIVIYTSGHSQPDLNEFILSFIFNKKTFFGDTTNVYQECNYFESEVAKKQLHKGDSLGLFYYHTNTFNYISPSYKLELERKIKLGKVKFWGIDCNFSTPTLLQKLFDTTKLYLLSNNLNTSLLDSLSPYVDLIAGINHYAYKMEKAEVDRVERIYTFLQNTKAEVFYLDSWKPVLDFMKWVYNRGEEAFYMYATYKRRIELDQYRDSILFDNYWKYKKKDNVIIMGSMHSERLAYSELSIKEPSFGDYLCMESNKNSNPLRILITKKKVKLHATSKEEFCGKELFIYDLKKIDTSFSMRVYSDEQINLPWSKSFDYVVQIN